MDFFWKKQNWEQTDRHLLALQEAPFRRGLPSVELQPGITLIRGPRQVGKSTWLKLLLKKELDLGHPCFYYTCEDLNDYRDLIELIQSQKGVIYFFLDEVTFVKEWWRAVKKATDTDPKKVLVLTGSNSYDLRQGLDLMPGRWSHGAGELSLLPMLFEEWCSMIEQAKWPKKENLQRLRDYMRIGGFPAALAEAGPEMKSPEYAKQIYTRWILGDTIKLNRQELFMRELLGQLAKIIGSSVSLHTLAQKTQLMSYHTAQDYLSVLEQAFALRSLYAYDPDKDSFRFKKEKKFYFTDPIIFWVAHELAGTKPSEDYESQLAEMIAAEWLFRKFKRLGYYSTRDGEVDFIVGREKAIEVKWAPVVHNLSKTYKNLHLPDKRVWTQGNFFNLD
jgi:uncharacterized protein